jgi:protein phosphatase
VSPLAGPTRRLGLRHGAATDPGRIRGSNEDAFAADPEIGLFVVADGLGGHAAGEVASAIGIARLCEVVRADKDVGDERREEILRQAIAAAHRAVSDAAREPSLQGMGTTLVAGWIGSGDAWVANVGDSRCYRFRAGSLVQLSLDDTVLEEIRRAGLLPDDPAYWPPRSQLSQAVGLRASVVPHIERFELDAGDRLLLCSDGLTDMLDDDEIAPMLAEGHDPPSTCAGLVRAANERGGLDNTTVLIVDLEEAAAGPAARSRG